MDPLRVGKVISCQRKKLNITQAQLAETLNVSNKSVSRWETGVTMPDISLLIPLSEALHISLNDLLNGESEAPAGDELLKETVRLSAAQAERQKHRFSSMILNLMAAGLVVLILAPWRIDSKSSVNLSLIDPPGFWVLLVQTLTYCAMIDLLDLKDRTVRLLSYAPLALNAFILGKDLLTVIRELSPGTQMTLVPVISCVYAVVIIAVHSALFTQRGSCADSSAAKRRLTDWNNGHLFLFSLAVVTVAFVTFVPAVSYSGVSYRTLLGSFVERKPLWLGNYQNNDSYDGVILTYGYVSLLLCPLLCLWAKLRSKTVFVLTNLSLLHVLASVINYPIRFADGTRNWLTPAFFISCLLPAVSLFLLNAVYFKPTFTTPGKEKLSAVDLVVQITYLVLTVTVFSYLFSAVPFFGHLDGSTGEWHLMNILSAMALGTGIQIAIDANRERQSL